MIALYDSINSKHEKVLQRIYAVPVQPNIHWDDIETLLIAAGCALIEGMGSRVRFEKDGMIATFHRPHPAKEAKRYQVRDARAFLNRLGLRP